MVMAVGKRIFACGGNVTPGLPVPCARDLHGQSRSQRCKIVRLSRSCAGVSDAAGTNGLGPPTGGFGGRATGAGVAVSGAVLTRCGTRRPQNIRGSLSPHF
jgi:hypothetical protein